jgi:hypothetical protein
MSPNGVIPYLILKESRHAACNCLFLSSSRRSPTTGAGWARLATASETGILEFPSGGPKKLWSVPINGGYSGPAVVGNKVYITDYESKDARPGNNPAVASKREGKERLLCLDAASGKEIWNYEYDCPYAVSYSSGPRCTPTIHEGKIYNLGSMGDHASSTPRKARSSGRRTSEGLQREDADLGFHGPSAHLQGHGCVSLAATTLVAFNKDTGKGSLEIADNAGLPAMLAIVPDADQAGGAADRHLAAKGHKRQSRRRQTPGTSNSRPMPACRLVPRQHGDYLFVGGIGFLRRLPEARQDEAGGPEVWRGDRIKKNGVYP